MNPSRLENNTAITCGAGSKPQKPAQETVERLVQFARRYEADGNATQSGSCVDSPTVWKLPDGSTLNFHPTSEYAKHGSAKSAGRAE